MGASPQNLFAPQLRRVKLSYRTPFISAKKKRTTSKIMNARRPPLSIVGTLTNVTRDLMAFPRSSYTTTMVSSRLRRLLRAAGRQNETRGPIPKETCRQDDIILATGWFSWLPALCLQLHFC